VTRPGSHPRRVLALQKLGTRAVVAEVLVQKAEKVARTVENLLDAGAAGDLAAAKALVPWIDQAYGKPTERVEYKYPSSIDELEQMSEEELERLVAQGRQQRLQGLQAVPDASDWRRGDPPLGVVDGDNQRLNTPVRAQQHCSQASPIPCVHAGSGHEPPAC